MTYFWSVDKGYTIKGLGRLSVFLVVPIAMSILPNMTQRSFKIILNCFTISNLILGLFFLATASHNYINIKSLSVFTYHDLVQTLDLNAIYVSVFYFISYFFLLTKIKKTKFDFLGLLFLAILIMLLSSKTVIATFIVCNLLYFLLFIGFGKLKSIKGISLLLILLMMFFFTSKKILERIVVEKTSNVEEVWKREKFNRIYPWTGTSIRILQLRNLRDQIKEDNIFWKGFGLFSSRENLKQRHLTFNTYYGYHSYNYHNMYAQALSELGIIGLLILLGILFFGFKKAMSVSSFFMFTFYFIMFTVFITESFLWVHRGVFLFVIFNTLFFKVKFQKSNQGENKNLHKTL
ncbi:O-antigen ligase family protein [Winogradskyella sp. A2]|uniref:O-antigen ligase family protein n=1 Tax=Winogradskyella sp. A2 TaxID=3366944 RepID=UPI00398C2E29